MPLVSFLLFYLLASMGSLKCVVTIFTDAQQWPRFIIDFFFRNIVLYLSLWGFFPLQEYITEILIWHFHIFHDTFGNKNVDFDKYRMHKTADIENHEVFTSARATIKDTVSKNIGSFKQIIQIYIDYCRCIIWEVLTVSMCWDSFWFYCLNLLLKHQINFSSFKKKHSPLHRLWLTIFVVIGCALWLLGSVGCMQGREFM